MTEERKRKSLHTKLQDFLAKVNNHATTPLTHLTASEMMVRVEEVFAEFRGVQIILESTAASDAAFDVQAEAGNKVEQTFSEARGKLRALLSTLAPPTATPRNPTPTTSTTAAIRLPTISLPNFDGKFSDWLSFKDLFTAAVANNKDLAGAQKLQYLKTAISGEPANLIKYLSTTDTNYAEAWKILEGRYEHKRELAYAQVNRILDLKPVKSENSRDLQTLLDHCKESLHSLKTLGCPTSTWDDIIVVLLVRKLDPASRREWAKSLTGTNRSTFEEFDTFLSDHIRGLTAAGESNAYNPGERRGADKQMRVNLTLTESASCPVCRGSHSVMECKDFLNKTQSERSSEARKARLCFNCLRSDHMIRSCTSQRKCKRCGARHHTLLHEERRKQESSSSSSSASTTAATGGGTNASISSHVVSAETGGLVMTAVADVSDKYGRRHACRIFIDNGSQGDFITTRTRDFLQLPQVCSNMLIKGVGESSAGATSGYVKLRLHSRYNDNCLEVQLLVIPKITGKLPSVMVEEKWEHLSGIQLADDKWGEPAPVDILLGVKYFHKILLYGRRPGKLETSPVAWETIFGWCVAGVCLPADAPVISSHHVQLDPYSEQLRKFWEVEEPPKRRILTREEKDCEEHFRKTYKRVDGRFVVAVPFNDKRKELGWSKDIAIRRLHQVERRLQRNPDLQRQYVDFMREYESLGHMSKLHPSQRKEIIGVTNYMCHHFVQNESSSSTKLRVVFDCSQATSTGVSFNDAMLVGATLQDDLYDLLLRFRTFAVVLKADVTKMFRQFRLKTDDAQMHRIVWRESPDKPVEEYVLNTVTYGTAYAPNLATRCMQQLGKDCEEAYPDASRTLLNNCYVDDTLGGHGTPEKAIKLFKELCAAVATAGLELRKWCSNSAQVMEAIPEELRETSSLVFSEDDETLIKALGVQWHPASDSFRFKKIEFCNNSTTTRRSLLSELARVFDPLGLVSCVTVRGKLLLQELWKLPIEWDDVVPTNISDAWSEYKDDLQLLPQLIIPRRITVCNVKHMELHCFSDSSERALGGNVYLRSIMEDGTVQVRFITSKTRVAPVRQVTLPRLELCAAVLVAELGMHVKECLQLDAEMYFWSDSTITLTWIAASPRRWKTYVANRVATIQELTPLSSWRHVAGAENPADLASRGCSVRELMESKWWWKGPEWLSRPELPEFPKPIVKGEIMEERPLSVAAVFLRPVEDARLTRFSSLSTLKRITAWYFRILLYRARREGSCGVITITELRASLFFWIQKTQRLFFKDEYKQLAKGGQIGKGSHLRSLNPYMDNGGIMRVSGRTINANLPEKTKHQIILPGESHLVHLLVVDAHRRSLHGGFQLTWSTLQTEYWLVRGRDKVRKFVRACVCCRRYRAKAAEQLMGALPSARVTPSRAFLHTGVDYAGPFNLKDVVGRVPKVFKGYLCLFACLSTKAVHLEAVSTLSSEGFLAAFRRFVARKGLPGQMYSDCGTNFVGAERELRTFVSSTRTDEGIARDMSEQGIKWNFNPPAAPHMGGLWEAGVKSAKHHLRRVVGNQTLTFEQFSTLLAQIEAVLNSRPLYARSSDPEDLEPLTPGHFLIGSALTTAPDPSLLDVKTNRLSQYQRIQQQLQQFWKRWSLEYINTLQQRRKWMWEKPNVKVGTSFY